MEYLTKIHDKLEKLTNIIDDDYVMYSMFMTLPKIDVLDAMKNYASYKIISIRNKKIEQTRDNLETIIGYIREAQLAVLKEP